MKYVLAGLLFLHLNGCGFQTLDITPEEVVSDINESIQVGASSESIEEYFKIKGIVVSYDRFANRYQGIIRHPETNFHAITIYVYLDKNKKFIKAEAMIVTHFCKAPNKRGQADSPPRCSFVLNSTSLTSLRPAAYRER